MSRGIILNLGDLDFAFIGCSNNRFHERTRGRPKRNFGDAQVAFFLSRNTSTDSDFPSTKPVTIVRRIHDSCGRKIRNQTERLVA